MLKQKPQTEIKVTIWCNESENVPAASKHQTAPARINVNGVQPAIFTLFQHWPNDGEHVLKTRTYSCVVPLREHPRSCWIGLDDFGNWEGAVCCCRAGRQWHTGMEKRRNILIMILLKWEMSINNHMGWLEMNASGVKICLRLANEGVAEGVTKGED